MSRTRFRTEAVANAEDRDDAVTMVGAQFPNLAVVVPSHGPPAGRELLHQTIGLARRFDAILENRDEEPMSQPSLLYSHDLPPETVGSVRFTHAIQPVETVFLVCVGLTLLGAASIALMPWTHAPAAVHLVPAGIGVVTGFFAWRLTGQVRAARSTANWLVRADDSGLYVKVRSYFRHYVDDGRPDVIFLPVSSVASLRPDRKTVRFLESEDLDPRDHKNRRPHLDIRLRDSSRLPDLAERIRSEQELALSERRGPRRLSDDRIPLELTEDGLLRVHWRLPGHYMETPLEHAVIQLGHWYDVHERWSRPALKAA